MAVDPATWKDLVYLFLVFPLGTAEFVMSVGLWSASAALIALPVTINYQDAGFMHLDVGHQLVHRRNVQLRHEPRQVQVHRSGPRRRGPDPVPPGRQRGDGSLFAKTEE